MTDVLYNNTVNSVVTILTRSTNGTYNIGQGFWIEGPNSNVAGYLATAAHVITDYSQASKPIAQNIWIHTTNPNAIYRIQNSATSNSVVMGRDVVADVALLRVPVANAPALTYANSRTAVSPGDSVTIIGYPLGFDVQSVCRGVIRDNKGSPDTFYSKIGGGFMESVLTDCSIYSGNSGGPLLADDGKWIGILSWGVGNDGAMNGGVASYLAKAIFDYFQDRYVRTPLTYPKGYLGIRGRPMDMLLSVSKGLSSVGGYQITGLDTITTVPKFSIGDIILTINGVDIGILNNQFSLFTEIQLSPPGTSLTIRYRPVSNPNNILTKVVNTCTYPASRDVLFTDYRSLPHAITRKHKKRSGGGIV